MQYKELKEFLNSLTDEQLEQQVAVINGDSDDVVLPDYCNISTEDEYAEHHGDFIGNLEAVKAYATDADEHWENIIEDLVKQPAGTVTIHSNV